MTLKERIDPLKMALVLTGGNVHHHFRTGLKAPYIIWAENYSTGLESDNHKSEQQIHGTTDLFTKNEYDPLFDAIQEALNRTENVLDWELNSTQYEEETGLIHYEWKWTVI